MDKSMILGANLDVLYTRPVSDDGEQVAIFSYNLLMTRHQWEALKAKIDLFYASTSDSEIEAHIAHATDKLLNPSQYRADPAPEREPTPGYLYLIYSESGHYKIGISRDLPTRTKAIATKIPFKTRLVYQVHVTDCRRLEQYLHQRFSIKRIEGTEWFNLLPSDVDWITSQQWAVGSFANAVIGESGAL